MNVPGYERLAEVLRAAYEQAAKGKGAERHADGKAFHEQPMQQLISLYGTGFAMGQAAKKAQEAQRMATDPAIRELLGAINYLAGAVIFLQDNDVKGAKRAIDAGVDRISAAAGVQVLEGSGLGGEAFDHG